MWRTWILCVRLVSKNVASADPLGTRIFPGCMPTLLSSGKLTEEKMADSADVQYLGRRQHHSLAAGWSISCRGMGRYVSCIVCHEVS
jgi:hypothetical protein